MITLEDKTQQIPLKKKPKRVGRMSLRERGEDECWRTRRTVPKEPSEQAQLSERVVLLKCHRERVLGGTLASGFLKDPENVQGPACSGTGQRVEMKAQMKS